MAPFIVVVIGVAGGRAGRASGLPIFSRRLPFLISEVIKNSYV